MMNRISQKTSLVFRRYHRITGILSAFFLINIAITGLLLNHSSTLDLQNRKISHPLVMVWYGLNPQTKPVSFQIGNSVLSFWENRLFFNGSTLGPVSKPVGAFALEHCLLAVSSREIHLISYEGQLIERLGPESLPPGEIELAGISLEHNHLLVIVSDNCFEFDADLLNYYPTSLPDKINPPQSIVTPPELRRLMYEDLLGEGISLHKLLFDLHSGRFFGVPGILFTDLMALALIFLVSSGLITWYRFRAQSNL